ncbi:hypothetical protein GCM10010198_11190 [Nocardia seriolae]|nr:hypothetical protein NS07_v2contig00125-0018 [Nocardia seriolae]GEM27504.1 hypothetical protein NS2_57430 [Nocardia seriolae NBRC 15557]
MRRQRPASRRYNPTTAGIRCPMGTPTRRTIPVEYPRARRGNLDGTDQFENGADQFEIPGAGVRAPQNGSHDPTVGGT